MRDQLQNVQQIQASQHAFAAILGDGSVVTWGSAACGGDSSAVRDQLQNVQHIAASNDVFAAILCDGSVVIWGKFGQGGESDLQEQLKNVQQIHARDTVLAAILGDGSVVTLGSPVVSFCPVFFLAKPTSTKKVLLLSRGCWGT